MTTKYNNCETQKYCGVYRVLASENKKEQNKGGNMTEIYSTVLVYKFTNKKQPTNEKEKMIWI